MVWKSVKQEQTMVKYQMKVKSFHRGICFKFHFLKAVPDSLEPEEKEALVLWRNHVQPPCVAGEINPIVWWILSWETQKYIKMAQMIEIFPDITKGLIYPKVNAMTVDDLGPLLLTWFNSNPSMDK